MMRIIKNLFKKNYAKNNKRGLEFDESTPFFSGNYDKVFSDNETINNSSKKTSLVIFALIFLLLAQTFKLQIVDRNIFSTLAENNRVREVTFPADRGVIFDRNRSVLAKNQAIFDLITIPRELPSDGDELNKLADKVANLTGSGKEDIIKVFNKVNRTSRSAELVLENINIEAAIAIETAKEKLPGVSVRHNAIRNYPDAKYFSHLIGYTGRVSMDDLKRDTDYEMTDFTGKDGLEVFYENQLKGKKGIEKTEVDSRGVAISVINKANTEAGKSLVLALDGNLQKRLQDSLEAEMKKKRSTGNGGAVAVALDPRNGQVLALVSLPAYDNNIFANPSAKEERLKILNDTVTRPMINRAIAGLYPPGSTIKPVMSVAALKEGIVKEDTIILDQGVLDVFYGSAVTHFYGWNRGGLGSMNAVSAIAHSSDIYFYTVGGGYGNFKGLGVDKIGEYFREFNLGRELGIDLPGEADGLVPTQEYKMDKFGEEWNLGNTYHLSIGQGYLLTTPLQVASWTEIMANGGTLYKPQIVDKIVDSDTDKIFEDIQPKVIREFNDEKKYIEIARRGMRETVVSGTAQSLNSLKVTSAGKTGTAQYGDKAQYTHSWFTAFAPYDNPEIVITILIEGGGEGSSTAVPIVRDALNWYFGERINPTVSPVPSPAILP